MLPNIALEEGMENVLAHHFCHLAMNSVFLQRLKMS